MIYRMIKDPQAIRDFARTCFDPGVFPDYFARSFSDMPNGAREMAPAKDALWLQRSLPDDA
jgi:hypothetical protein